MSLYRRGKKWWYRFEHRGQRIEQSTKSTNKNIAKDIERERRQQLERAAAGVPLPAPPMLFRNAAKQWIENKTGSGLQEKSLGGYEQCIPPLVAAFGSRPLADITFQDVLDYRTERLKKVSKRTLKKYSHRTVNYELLCLRGIIGKVRWTAFEEELSKYGQRNFHLKERHDVGKAISFEDELALLAACLNSQSPALHPIFVVSIDTGLRSSELKALRHRDLRLTIEKNVIVDGELVVPKSKTKKGEKREIGFTPRVCAVLTHWLRRFPSAGPDSFVFPRHEIRQIKGNRKMVELCKVNLDAPMGSWKSSWKTARKTAKVKYRWHDLRHTFISRLAGNPAVSEQTVRDIAGHVSPEMMERYSHIHRATKRAAISALSANVEAEHARVLAKAEPAKPASASGEKTSSGLRVGTKVATKRRAEQLGETAELVSV